MQEGRNGSNADRRRGTGSVQSIQARKTLGSTLKYCESELICLRLSSRLPWRTSEIVDNDMPTSAASLDLRNAAGVDQMSKHGGIRNFRHGMRLVLIALDDVGEHIKVILLARGKIASNEQGR